MCGQPHRSPKLARAGGCLSAESSCAWFRRSAPKLETRRRVPHCGATGGSSRPNGATRLGELEIESTSRLDCGSAFEWFLLRVVVHDVKFAGSNSFWR